MCWQINYCLRVNALICLYKLIVLVEANQLINRNETHLSHPENEPNMERVEFLFLISLSVSFLVKLSILVEI